MKLYFLTGLPTETDEDVLGIVSVGKNALAVGQRLGKRPKVTVSVSTHVPKPHTPFQWCAMDAPEEVRRKQELLREAVRGVRGLTLKVHDSTTSFLEGILARGDRKLGVVIERAYLNGARFDSWEEQLDLEVWREAFAHFRIDTERYLGTLPTGARLPWDHIDVGLEDGFLAREYRKALQSRLSPPCGKVKGAFVHATNAKQAGEEHRRLVCYDCGIACDMTKMRERRVDYLEKLGAFEASAPVRLPLVTDERPGVARAKHHPERYRPPQRAGRVVRYRLRYAKKGASALLGHLDLIRELGRVIRRAGVRLYYTEGFHPKPSMSFGPALSLGVMSIDEYVDVKLVEPPNSHDLLQRLNRAAAGGLEFLGAAPLAPGARPLGRLIVGARYRIALAAPLVERQGGEPWLAARVRAFMARESQQVTRRVKGIGRTIDVRSVVRSLALASDREQPLEELGIAGNFYVLDVELAISERGSAKIGEVLQGIFDGEEPEHLAVRTRLLTGAGETGPLDWCGPCEARSADGAAAAAPGPAE